MFLFQRLSIALQRGERGCLPGNIQHRENAVCSHYLFIISSSLRPRASGPKIKIKNNNNNIIIIINNRQLYLFCILVIISFVNIK